MVNGKFYGVGGGGSCHAGLCGIVFEITPSGTERVLYKFKGGSDGIAPVGNLANLNGTLYGVTTEGGGKSRNCVPPGCGTVFTLSTGGEEHVLYRFKGGKDGDYPLAGLTPLNGMLYGTTDHGGGYNGPGTVFEISPTGRERVLYRFKGGANDGWGPQAPLIVLNGNLYGTTAYGGCDLCDGGLGTVFSISTSGVEHMLYAFQGAYNGGDGAFPEAALIAVNNVLYGTTSHGGYTGGYPCGSSMDGCGTVFSVTPTGKEQILYRFRGKSDGVGPWAALAFANGRLFGTTLSGGIGSKYDLGYGTVFQLTLTGNERINHRFQGAPDGATPAASLVLYDGKFYGTTTAGGDGCSNGPPPPGCGTFFKLSPLP